MPNLKFQKCMIVSLIHIKGIQKIETLKHYKTLLKETEYEVNLGVG